MKSFNKIDYNGVYEHVVTLIHKNLPQIYTYHNLDHTLGVVDAVEKLSKAIDVNTEDRLLLLTSAILHDTGFTISSEEHEFHSCQIARQILTEYLYSSEDIEKICKLIMATKAPVKPDSILEKILCDADMSYISTDQYYIQAERLKSELINLGKLSEISDWKKLQMEFLIQHKFYTEPAKEWYGAAKEKLLRELS